MIRTLRGLLVTSAALCALASPSLAQNVSYTPGTGGTLGAVTCGTSVSCPKYAPIDSGAGDATNPTAHSIKNSPVDSAGGDMTDTTNHAQRVNAPLTYNLLNQSATYNVVANVGGTAYAAGQLICSTTSAATCSSGLPSFSLPLSGGRITGYRMRVSDSTSTAWPLNSVISIKQWSAQPTLNASDRQTYALTSGTANWLGDMTCTSNGEEGDGATFYCIPIGPVPELKGVSSVFVALIATSGSGATTTAAWTATLVPTIEQ